MAIKPIEILINAKDNASAVFSSLQSKVVAVGAAVVTYFGVSAFVGAIKGAAEFESAMSRVQGATGASKEEMTQLSKAAQDAGASTKYTSVEAAGALENLAKAGLNAKDAVATLPAVLQLAQAGDIGLAESSELVTKAVMGMGLAFSDAGRVADVLALGANATNTSVQGLAQALSYAAPVANSLGLSLESTVAIVGKFADAGIDASRAGTALNSILSQFSNPASKFRNELAAAGITTGDFEKALHQLAAAGPRGSQAILAVGQEAGPALRALLNQGMGALDELTEKLRSAEGSAADVAKVMQDNLIGSTTGLASAWQTVKDVFGTPVLPVIKQGVDQLSAALRGAVADGTVQRFGETFAQAFQNAMKWVREFVASVDFTAMLSKMQVWADEAGATMDRVGEYATNAGNIVKTAWGVMTAGSNTVMAAIYKIAEAFAGVSSNLQSGLALIMEGFAKVTFGDLSKSFASAAKEIRLSAEATSAVSGAFADKATAALEAAAQGAQLARDGFSGLSTDMGAAGQQAVTTSAALANVTAELVKTADANAAATAAQQKKAKADEAASAASDQHRVALAQLRADYKQLIQSGDLDAAAAKLQQINQKLRETPGAAADAGKAAQEAAEQLKAAFERLGVVSSTALAEQAANARRDYETIKQSGVATAEDLAAAFKKSAEDAIAANKGVAPSWVEAEAAARGLRVEVDETGKSVVTLNTEFNRAAGTSSSAGSRMRKDWGGVRSAVDDASEAVRKYQQRVAEKYGRPGEGEQGIYERGRVSTRGEELGEGVQEVGTGGYQFRNKAGFTSDAKGNAQQQFIWTRTAIIDYLTESGLDEVLAEDLSKQFAQPDGTVPYMASAAQKQWGGKYGTLAEALGKMSEYYKYGAGKHEAGERTAYLKGQGGVPAPSPAPAPQRPSTSMFGSQSVTLNINLDGRGYGQVKTDTEGVQVLQALMLELERSKSLSGY